MIDCSESDSMLVIWGEVHKSHSNLDIRYFVRLYFISNFFRHVLKLKNSEKALCPKKFAMKPSRTKYHITKYDLYVRFIKLSTYFYHIYIHIYIYTYICVCVCVI